MFTLNLKQSSLKMSQVEKIHLIIDMDVVNKY